MDENENVRSADCSREIKAAISKTLNESRDVLERRYRISPDHLRQAIGAALVSLAVNEFESYSSKQMDPTQKRDLILHVQYLIGGTIGATTAT